MEIKEITSITISIISVMIAILSFKRSVLRERKQVKKKAYFYQIFTQLNIRILFYQF